MTGDPNRRGLRPCPLSNGVIGIVVSTADTASEHIGEQLLAQRSWERWTDTDQPPERGGGTVYRHDHFELRTFDEWHLELTNVATVFDDPTVVVFASRHSGETGPLLTVHHTGNFGAAEYGGTPRSLATAAPHTAAAAVAALEQYAPTGYDVGLETTHHGPTEVGTPSFFIELGSTADHWTDPDGAAAVARAILTLQRPPASPRSVVGIGGGHYAPRFTRIVRETDWAVGHIAADWGLTALEEPAEPVLHQLFEHSNTTRFVVDGTHPELVEQLSALGYEQVSETWLRETTGVPIELADRLTAVYPNATGVRFGAPAQTATPTTAVDVHTLPSDLLDTVTNIDREAVLDAFREHLLAFSTDVDTDTPAATVVAPHDTPVRGTVPAPLLSALRRILTVRYETVAVDEDTVVATRTAFDPDRAAARGVPEGPKYGTLAAGSSVDVDGQTVEPEAVHTTVTDRFALTSDSA